MSTSVQIGDKQDRAKRKSFVVAQYNGDSAAEGYTTGYADPGVDGRVRRTRIELIHKLLENVDSGRLLDAGSGPGMLVHSLLRSPGHDFTATALDQSLVMARYCIDNAPGETRKKLTALVGDLESLPFADASFDVTVATGSLEYTNARTALAEIARVTAPTGIAIVSMLNPLSPYWLTHWFLRSPARRALDQLKMALGSHSAHRQGVTATGIRAYRSGILRALAHQSGFTNIKVIYFGPTVLIPPFDRHPGLIRVADRMNGTIGRLGLTRLLSTGYLIVAYRT